MKPTYKELQEQLETSQREFRSADITMQNLEAKCEKMAAENAEVKSDRDTLARYWIEDGGDEECAKSYCEETPATDAFLAEVRAQGVDSAVETIMVLMNHQHVAVAEVLHILRTHAAKIRKGVQS